MMQGPGSTGPCLALGLCLLVVGVAAYDHDCIVGSPPLCNHSLADDQTCRGAYSNDINAWKSMECDYVIYDVKARAVNTTKFIVIHAGGCDLYTEVLGDWVYNTLGNVNLFGLRPCSGLVGQACTVNRTVCVALHLSWTMPNQPPVFGLGFNPPQLMQYAKDPANQFIFLHEFDTPTDYPWIQFCNRTTPAYICVYSPDPDDVFNRKFYGTTGSNGIKAQLEKIALNEYIPCPVEVIDARNSSTVPGTIPGPNIGEYYVKNRFANLPCSGLYPQTVVIQGWQFETQDSIMAGVNLALTQRDQDENATANVLAPFAQAISIALGD